jgi:hypothetical protein
MMFSTLDIVLPVLLQTATTVICVLMTSATERLEIVSIRTITLLARMITSARAPIIVIRELVFLVIPETVTITTSVPTILVMPTQVNVFILIILLRVMMATLVLLMILVTRVIVFRVNRKNAMTITSVPMILAIVGPAPAFTLTIILLALMVIIAQCGIPAATEPASLEVPNIVTTVTVVPMILVMPTLVSVLTPTIPHLATMVILVLRMMFVLMEFVRLVMSHIAMTITRVPMILAT